MAYAALISLKSTLLHQSMVDLVCEKEQVQSFVQTLDFLQRGFLEAPCPTWDSRQRSDFEGRIREAVYQAQDIVDIHHVSIEYYVGSPLFGDLKSVIREIHSIKEEIQLTMMKKDEAAIHDAQPSWNSLRANFVSDNKNLMVGYDDLSLQIKDQLTGESSSSLQVISLVGMGGIGKTTLAIDTYKDPCVVKHFDIRGWVTVSQSYNARSIFLDLLDSMKQLSRDVRNKSDDEYLACHLYKCLKEKRYFIVIDDIWDSGAWDVVRRMFPNDENGSRIMLTTRITDVAAYATSSDNIYQMSLLSDDRSWNLLRAKVFGSESDQRFDFEKIGKDIARKCRGLPLSLVVMAGLLSRVDKTYEAWQTVATNLTNSLLSLSDDLISYQILKMSYDCLPQHLKSCFLYVGSFPEDHEIDVSRLTKLWVAEGFLDGVECRSLEEAAERYLRELIDRNLLSMSKQRSNGKVKTCKIHDLLLDVCVKESTCEKILHVMKWNYYNYDFPETSTRQRRLIIHQKGGFHHITPPISNSLVRSFVCIGKAKLSQGFFARFKLLRVLDVIQVNFDKFPEEVFELVNLRYIAMEYVGIVPSLLSKLCHLQTLMIIAGPSISYGDFDYIYLASKIWAMKHLRHIHLTSSCLEVPKINYSGDKLVLQELETMSVIFDSPFTKELIRRIPNIIKLCVRFLPGPYEFVNLANLHQLKELKINMSFSAVRKFGFPETLETLSLSGCQIPWEDLSPTVGSLPCLKVLKLKENACVGEKWEPEEGDFCALKVLELSNLKLKIWNSEPHHFPSLETLILSCPQLKEIPISWGESCSLNKIELGMRHPRTEVSALEIKMIQHDLGNEHFQLTHSNKHS